MDRIFSGSVKSGWLLLFLLIFNIAPSFAAIPSAPINFKRIMAESAAIESIVIEGRENYFLPPGSEGQLVAKTYPKDLNRKIRWEVINESVKLGYELKPTGLLIVSPRSELGWLTVRASAEGCLPLEQRIDIDCECHEENGPCGKITGAGDVFMGSVDVRLSLGKVAGGRSAGDLFLYAEEPLAILSTPEAMRVNSSSDQVIPFYRDGLLEQVQTPQAIVNFIRYSPLKYEIHFYDMAFRTNKLEDGTYSLDPTALPLAVWRIENPHETGETINHLMITEIREGKAREFYYTYEASDHSWSLISGNGQKIESKTETTHAAGDKMVRTEIAGPDGSPVHMAETVYHDFAFGEKRIREIVDPDGARLTTEYRYQTSAGPGYGKLAARIDPDGGWVRYEYDEAGRIIREVRPFLESPFAGPDEKSVVIVKRYTPVDSGDQNAGVDRHRPRQVTETVQGIETARTYYAYIRAKDGSRTEITERCTLQGTPYGHPTNLRTVATYYGRQGNAPQAGKIKCRQFEDGRLATYMYETGRLQLSSGSAECRFIPGKGQAARTTITQGTTNHPEGIPYRTTREITITDAMGRKRLMETFVKTAEGFARIHWRFNTYDRMGRLVETLHSNQTRTESTWDCCGKTSETHANGITTAYTYDDLKRLASRTNQATGVVTTFTYDAAGRRLTTTKKKDGMSLSQASRYDTAGRLTEQIDAAGLVTRYAFDGLVSTTTRPGGATEITTRHLDDNTRSVTGTGVVPRFYQYGINSDGSRWSKVFIGEKDSPRWEKTVRDLVGRVVRVEKPGFTDLEAVRKTYDRKGRLIRLETSGRAATLYSYDALGALVMIGLDTDGDGRLTPASMDRITKIKAGFRQIEGDWWQETTCAVLARDNSDKETIVAAQRERLTGWKNHTISELITIDIYGNETRSIVTLDRFNRTRTETIHTPDSDTPARKVYVDGRLVADTDKTGITMTYAYDALGRGVAVNDPRKGVSRLHYDDKGRPDYVADAAGNRTRFEYHPATGRIAANYNPLHKATHYEYNTLGQLVRTWGDVPYPVEYRYDSYGQMKVMKTFRGGSGWSNPTWPVDTGVDDRTTWHYQPSTGLLLAKEDAMGNRTTYAYGPGGALATRTWARLKNGQPLRTTYRYDPATGNLTEIDYSDDTPEIGFAYDRLGRMVRVSDAAGVHRFAYNEKLALISEGVTGPQIYEIHRRYDDLGRAQGFALDDGYVVDYTYDDKGRFNGVDWQIGDQIGETIYRYLEDSDRLAGMESKNGLSVRYAYEPYRDVKTAVVNAFNDRLISRYDYQYDPLGRRINAKTSGEAFGEGGFWLYGYNNRNELTQASRFEGLDLKDQSRPVRDREQVYGYDPIGNRKAIYAGNNKIEYLTNALNQYEQISGQKQSAEALTHDADGNLVEDGRFYYSWNGENRLVRVTPKGNHTEFEQLEFAYDYLGRLFRKRVIKNDKDSGKHADEQYFLYDGWNVIKEGKNSHGTDADRFYVWGLDISQSRGGAGGAGGLLAAVEQFGDCRYVYDGIGNIGQMVKDEDGRLAAHYDDNAFGAQVAKAGVEDHGFWFSTKRYDSQAGLYYYGGRYYSPQNGRWINKDPIAEYGGHNLYAFVKNAPTNYIDKHGLQEFSTNAVTNTKNGYSIETSFFDTLREIYGLPFSILSGDIFRSQIEDSYNDTQCDFLITITGIFTFENGNQDFNDSISELPKYLSIQNPTYVFNPSGFAVLDPIQIFGHESGAIDVIAIAAARKMSNAAIKAQDNNCNTCFTINVVAHSQGTMVFKTALNLLPEKVKDRIKFVGLGGEVAIDGTDMLISARNIADTCDLVPWTNWLRAHDGFGGDIEYFTSLKLPFPAHDSENYIGYLHDHP